MKKIAVILLFPLILISYDVVLGDYFMKNGEIMFLIDPENGKIIRANRSAAVFYGYPREQLESMTIQQINTFTREQVAAEMRQAASEQRNFFIFRHRLADGEVKRVRVFSYPVMMDGKAVLFSTVHDESRVELAQQTIDHYSKTLEAQVDAKTTEALEADKQNHVYLFFALLVQLLVILFLMYVMKKRRIAEKRLQESKRQMDGIIKNFPIAIVRAETDNVNVGYFNNEFYRLFGWELEDIDTMEKWWTNAYPDAGYRERVMKEWEVLIKETHEAGLTTSPHPMEAKVACKDGTQKTCLAWYHYNAGNVFGIFIDVTAQRAAEEELREAHRELEEKNRELMSLNRDLDLRVKEEIDKQYQQEQILIQQSKMAAMGEMINAIAHQWRQPLNALGLMIQDMEDAYEYGELDQGYIQKLTDETMGQVNYMSRTIDDFREFFKPNKRKKTFDVRESIEETIHLVEAQFKNNNIEIVRRINCSDCTLTSYPTEFKQVILNLLSNAKDAILETPRGETWGEVVITVDESDSELLISLQDNGGGIPDDVIGRVFDPYFTTKEEGKGTGIGLYMSKTIMEQHMDGTIRVENRGEGACFYVSLKRG
jgi:PAS domain S-box-containing protein